MTFDGTRGQFTQEHFTVIEIDAPTVFAGFGTPLSAGGLPSTELTTYKFTDYAGILAESNIWKCIKSIGEIPTKLQPGKGLAARGTASIKFTDFPGDPNPFAPDVTAQVKAQGTYFGKFDSRNVLVNRDCRIKNYRLNPDGTADLAASETRYYIVDKFNGDSKGGWTLKLKDELARVNFGESVWPLEQDGFLRFDVDDAVTLFSVDPNINYVIGDTIRIGDELSKVANVADIGTGAATITVGARGSDIIYTNTLSKTDKDDHSAGDEIVLCDVSDNEHIADLLKRILVDVGVDASFIPIVAWTVEVDEWLAGIRVNTIWIENLATSDVLVKILTYYQLDMWFDPVDREVKLSAVSVWQQSSSVLTEGNEIDFESIKFSKNENLRATRALVVYDKKYLARSESIENYNKGSLFTRPELETDDFYGKSKVKHFEFSFVIGTDAADLLVNRWVSRYINPINYSWTTQERKLNFKQGDIVDLNTSVDVGFDGLPSTQARGQILSIQPKYTSVGREYIVSALTYEPVFADNSEIVISGNITNVNLYTQYAGAPSAPITITFIFDGAKLSGTSNTIPAMKAGAFPIGSKIIIIMVNETDLMGRGGDGGEGQTLEWDPESDLWFTNSPFDGQSGGVVYDAQGVETDIYFSGATPSIAYPIADGYLLAPSAGDGAFDGSFTQGVESGAVSGRGGDGGDGSSIGTGGDGGLVVGTIGVNSIKGADGTSDRVTGSFGQAGNNNDANGGLAGSGIIDNGATVTLFGSNSTRYINGNGDH